MPRRFASLVAVALLVASIVTPGGVIAADGELPLVTDAPLADPGAGIDPPVSATPAPLAPGFGIEAAGPSVPVYDQCANSGGTGFPAGNADPGCQWINGNLTSNNSLYTEGDATPQRIQIGNLTAGSSHTVTFRYGTTKGGKHAYDYITSYNASEKWISATDRCDGITNCTGSNDSSTFAIPTDPNAGGFDAAANPRVFTMVGGTITAVSTPAISSGSYAGDSDTDITVTFTAQSSGALCGASCSVVLWFGAHIAEQRDWGAGTGASSISGSPFHVALGAVDGAAAGAKDNQMQGMAAPNLGSLIVTKTLVGGPADYAESFTVHYVCTSPTTLDEGDLLITAGGTKTVSRLVGGSSCVVTEPSYPTLPAHYASWSQSFSPANGTVTIPDVEGSSATVAVTNTLTALYRELTTTPSGPGSVSRSSAGSSCAVAAAVGSTCGSYVDGTIVTLTATPSAGAAFSGWSGNVPAACLPAVSPCAVTMDQARSITATFAYTDKKLRFDGTGPGGIGLIGGGTPCAEATICEIVPHGTSLTIAAFPDAGASFVGWTGDVPDSCAPDLTPCVMTMDRNRDVVATFAVGIERLAVDADGEGTVSFDPPGATCVVAGHVCADFASGTTVLITATPAVGWEFTGWSGDVPAACLPAISPCAALMDEGRAITAVFTITQRRLTSTTIGEGTLDVSPAGTSCGEGCADFDYGTGVTLTATAAEGWVFAGWSGDVPAGCLPAANPCAAAMSADRDITATFEITQRRLTTSVDGMGLLEADPTGSVCAPGCADFDYGSSVALVATPGIGYVFAGWSGDVPAECLPDANPCTVTMTADRAITARFTIESRRITASIVGEGEVAFSPVGVSCGTRCADFDYGTSVSISATPAPGYVFAGWSGPVPAECLPDANPCEAVMDTDRDIAAIFTITTRRLTSGTDGEGTLSISPAGVACGTSCADYDYGTLVALTATPATGWEFTGWSGDVPGDCLPAVSPCDLEMNADRDVTAVFAITERRLTTSVTGSGTIERDAAGSSCGPACADFDYGTPLTLTATPDEGYAFAGWSGDVPAECLPDANPCYLEMNADRDVGATFVLTTRRLTSATEGAGSLGIAPGGTPCGTGCADYDYGTSVTLTATPDTGYAFAGWSGDVPAGCLPAVSPCELRMSIDRDVIASFVITTRQLTTSATGAGAIEVSPAGVACLVAGKDCSTHDYGTLVELTATPEAGYRFTGWSGDVPAECLPDLSPCYLEMTDDRDVGATFEIMSMRLTSTTLGEGTLDISPAGTGCLVADRRCDDYAYGTAVTLTATPAAGWVFAGWSGDVPPDCLAAVNPCALTMTGDRDVEALFEVTQRRLTVEVIGSGAVSADPAGALCVAGALLCADHDYGTSVLLVAEPATGYDFAGWSGDVPPACAASSSCELAMSADRAVVATFVIQVHRLTTSVSGSGSLAPTPSGEVCLSPADRCDAYDHGTLVSLTATPSVGWRFVGWSGDVPAECAPAVSPCALTIDGDRDVVAEFAITGRRLTSATSGEGTLGIAPAGDACVVAHRDCADFDYGTSVTLTATAAAGYRFAGWTGAVPAGCLPAVSPCALLMDDDRDVGATFIALRELVTDVAGSGSVARSPAGEACPAFEWKTETGACSRHDDGTAVTLTATAASGWHFTGWSLPALAPESAGVSAASDCVGASASCAITMDANAIRIAHFEQDAAPPPPPTVYDPKVVIDRTRNLPGAARLIDGGTWPPACEVRLVWTPGDIYLGTGIADEQGKISVPVTIPVAAKVGDYEVVGTCVKDGITYTASTPVEVYLPATDTAPGLPDRDLPPGAKFGLLLLVIAALLALASRFVPERRR